jgi:MFS family permease
MRWTRAQTSLAHSLRSIEGGLTQPFIGFIIDRIGARKCIFIGIVIIGVALMLMSRINSLMTFYVIFLVCALGNGLGIANAEFVAAANWFKRRRSLALGIVTAGFGFSGLMTPLIVYLIDTFGWRNALLILGTGALLIGLPLASIIKQRSDVRRSSVDIGEIEEFGDITASADGTVDNGQPPKDGTSEGLGIKECLKTKTFWVLCAYAMFSGFSTSAMSVLIVPALVSNHIGTTLAGWAVTGMTGFSLIGRLGFSYLGDYCDKRILLAIAAAFQAIGCFIFTQIHSAWMILPFLLFYGPGFGGQIPLIPAIQADCFGLKNFATIRGLTALGWIIPGVTAPFFGGWIYDMTTSYNSAFFIYAIICLFAVPTIFLMKNVNMAR